MLLLCFSISFHNHFFLQQRNRECCYWTTWDPFPSKLKDCWAFPFSSHKKRMWNSCFPFSSLWDEFILRQTLCEISLFCVSVFLAFLDSHNNSGRTRALISVKGARPTTLQLVFGRFRLKTKTIMTPKATYKDSKRPLPFQPRGLKIQPLLIRVGSLVFFCNLESHYTSLHLFVLRVCSSGRHEVCRVAWREWRTSTAARRPQTGCTASPLSCWAQLSDISAANQVNVQILSVG